MPWNRRCVWSHFSLLCVTDRNTRCLAFSQNNPDYSKLPHCNNGGCFENYHHLRYLFSLLSVEYRKDKVFCAICGKGLTASKSQRRAQFCAVSGNISDIVSCFGLPTDTSRIDGVLCNSCRTALLKYRKTGKKSISSDRLQTCNLCAWKLNTTVRQF